jgi:hypothetical protein
VKLLKNGSAMLKREAKSHGRDGQDFDELGGKPTGERTVELGPFSVERVHADVGTETRVTISENYHTIAIGAFVTIPVDPNDAAVKNGLMYCRDIANKFVNHEMKGARQLLQEMAGKR